MSENRPKPYLGNPQETIAVLNRYKFAFQKKFGQNFLIDTTGTNIKSLLQVAAVYCELEEALGKPVDLVTVSSLEQEARMPSEESFRKTVWKEKVDIYVAA